MAFSRRVVTAAPAEVPEEVPAEDPARGPRMAEAMAATVEVTVGVEGLQPLGQVTARRVAAIRVLEELVAATEVAV